MASLCERPKCWAPWQSQISKICPILSAFMSIYRGWFRFDLDLSARLEYLTLAVANAKSHPISATGRHETAIAFLTDLEEKLDVAQVQLEIYNTLLPHVNDAVEVGERIRLLSKRLFTMTEVWDKHLGRISDLLCHSFTKDTQFHLTSPQSSCCVCMSPNTEMKVLFDQSGIRFSMNVCARCFFSWNKPEYSCFSTPREYRPFNNGRSHRCPGGAFRSEVLSFGKCLPSPYVQDVMPTLCDIYGCIRIRRNASRQIRLG
jgi:hypothetical protein